MMITVAYQWWSKIHCLNSKKNQIDTIIDVATKNKFKTLIPDPEQSKEVLKRT